MTIPPEAIEVVVDTKAGKGSLHLALPVAALGDQAASLGALGVTGDKLELDAIFDGQGLYVKSPIASKVLPLLMLQSEADKRCPSGDNEQFFVSLRWLGRTVEYVLYPEEYHVIQASGRIDRRIDRMTRMLDWFDRFVRA